MDDLDRYIDQRIANSPDFARAFERGYAQFQIGLRLRLAREEAGMTKEEVARKLGTKKSAISRIENHSENIRLSTLEKFAEAVGKRLTVAIQ